MTVHRMSPTGPLTACFGGWLIMFTEADEADAVTYSDIFLIE